MISNSTAASAPSNDASDLNGPNEAGSAVASKTVAAIVLAALAVFYLVNALLLPNAETDDGVGPKMFPVVVGIVLLCTTLLGIVSMLRGKADIRPVTGNELLHVLWCIVLFALFTASIFVIGFAEAAAIFSVLTTMTVFGVRLSLRKALWVLFLGLVIGMILFLIFDVWLNVLLPVGWLEYLVFGGLGL